MRDINSCGTVSFMVYKERLMKEALELSLDDRRVMAEELHESLAPNDKRTEDEWLAEIDRRAHRAVAGEPGIPWADARVMLERRFGSF